MNDILSKAYQSGVFELILTRKDGSVEKFKSKNLITNAGKAGLASRINGNGGEAAFTYMAVGTGSTAASASDTTLQTELASDGLSRAAATASRITTSVTNDTARLALTFTITGTQVLREVGILNASSGGTLLCRTVFAAVTVNNGDSLTINYDIQSS